MSLEKSVRLQLILLIFFMLLGFFTIGYIGYQNMLKMKKDLDLVYFGSYVQTLKLKNLKEAYASDLLETVLKAKNKLEDVDVSIKKMTDIKNKIDDSWGYYKNSYKTDEEVKFIDRVDKAINSSLFRVGMIEDILKSKDKKRISTISYERIFDLIGEIDVMVQALIVYENDASYKMKNSINAQYEDSMYKMWLIMVIIFILGLIVSIFIGKNIHKNHKLLNEKSEQLKNANRLLKELSITDTLTGIYNRRYFELLYEKELKRCARDKSYFSFVMMDVDHFKQYNDTYGHGKGDEVLKTVALALKNSLKRPGDYLFRLGGEEFGVMFSGLDSEKSLLLCKMLLRAVEDTKMVHEKNSASKYVTMSMGLITVVPSNDTDAKKLTESADEALYKAKESGRNRVVVAK